MTAEAKLLVSLQISETVRELALAGVRSRAVEQETKSSGGYLAAS